MSDSTAVFEKPFCNEKNTEKNGTDRPTLAGSNKNRKFLTWSL